MKHIVSIPNRKECSSSTGVFTANGLNKVSCIRATRQATGLGLKEAKDLIEGLNSSHSIVIDTAGCIDNVPRALTALRECGLTVERSMDDPISLLRRATDLALEVDNVDLAADILSVVRKHV